MTRWYRTSWSSTWSHHKLALVAISFCILFVLEFVVPDPSLVPSALVRVCSAQAYIVCGDDEGRLWTYDIINLQNILRDKPAKPLQPTKVPKPSPAWSHMSNSC